MLEKLTLVIPTYNRQAFALRNMNYWSNKPVTIITMDGSQKPIPESELSLMGSNISYHHAPHSLAKRLSMALPLIKTPYVALYGDDEFFLPDGLEACIQFLDGKPDYVACCGQVIGFRPERGSIRGFGRYPKLEGLNIDNPSGVERIVRHMGNYVPSHVYAVSRTKPWIEAVKCFASRDFRVLAIGELQIEMCLSYAGKSRALPHVMWLRSYGETKPIRNTDPTLDESRPFDQWWHEPGAKEEKDAFIKHTASKLEIFDSGNQTEIDYNHIIAKAGDTYVKGVSKFHNNLQHKSAQKLAFSVGTLFSKIYKQTRNTIKKKYTLNEFGEKMIKRGVSVNLDQVLEIEKIVKDFHGYSIK
ncbi:MAG: TIGR00180 family glycosyltransferase [Pseudomonadota bacterium]